MHIRKELTWLGEVPDEMSRALEAQPKLTQLNKEHQAYNQRCKDSSVRCDTDIASSQVCAWEEHESLVEAWCGAVQLLHRFPDVMPSVQVAPNMVQACHTRREERLFGNCAFTTYTVRSLSG